MVRADHYPAQAEADMQRLQNEAGHADAAKDEAEELVERLEREMDEALDAGDDAEVKRLQGQHSRAEKELEVADQEFESVMDQIGSATTFWYEDDDDDDE